MTFWVFAYDPTKPGELNEDTLWHGYERIGSELSLSPSHVDRYYHAAEVVLDRASFAASGEARIVRKTAAELRYGGGKEQQAALDRFGIKRPLRYLMFPGTTQQALAPIRDDTFHELCRVCYTTGCRPQEILRVEARHYDSTNKRWVLPPSEAKGKKRPRIVYR